MIFIKVFQKIMPALFTLCQFSLSSKKSLLLLLVVSFLMFTCDEEKPVPTTGNITGTVTDQDNMPLPGVLVVLRTQGGTRDLDNRTTPNNGNYDFQEKAAGNYILIFSKSGYTGGTKEVTVEGGGIGNADIALESVVSVPKLAIKNDDIVMDTLDFAPESTQKFLIISNDGEEGSKLKFTIAKTAKWLTLSSAADSIIKNIDSAPKTIEVNIDRNMIEFTDQTATDRITVGANGSVDSKIIIVKVRQKQRNLLITPLEIVFDLSDCEKAEGSIITKTFILSSKNLSNLSYTIEQPPGWIFVDTKKLKGVVVSNERDTIKMMVNTAVSKEDEKDSIKIRYEEEKPILIFLPITYIAPPELSVMTDIMPNSTDRTKATIVSTITNISKCHNISHYGHVWSTTNPPNPDDSNHKTDEKEIATLPPNGMFTSELTGLRIDTNYYVMAYVRDHNGDIIKEGSVEDFNTRNSPPTAPVLIYPAHGDTGISLMPTLMWESSTDQDRDNITYDVFLGPQMNPTTIKSNRQSGTTYTVSSSLMENTTYYWKVVTSDGQGNETSSDIYRFTTKKLTAVISLSLSNSNFGSVNIGGSSTETLTIENTGDKSFDVIDITSSSPSIFIVGDYSKGEIAAKSTKEVIITFRPTSAVPYDETIMVNNNTISVSGTGIRVGEPNLEYVGNEIKIDDNIVEVAETGKTIKLTVRLRNSGDATATNVKATLTTTDGGIIITDDGVTFGDIISVSTKTNSGDFDFDIGSEGSSRDVKFTLNITSDEGVWEYTFSIPIQAPSIPITPSDRCSSSAPTLDVDTEYEIEINEVNLESYKLEASIQSYSNNNDSVRSFWFKVNVPSGGAMVKIYKVGVAFDPVIGFKQLFCPSDLNDYLEIGTSMKKYLDLGSAEEDESYTLTSSGVYNMRIYDYNNTSSTISFKIIVESR